MRILNRAGRHRRWPTPTPASRRSARRSCRSIAKYREQFVAGAEANGLSEERGRASCSEHDREVRGLRLQQVAPHGLRPDRLHDGLPQGPLSRSSSWRRCSRATFRAATSRRKDALVEHLEDCRRMDIDVRAAGREPLATPISRWPSGKIHFGLARHQGLRRQRGRGDRRRARKKAGRSASCSTSASGSIRRRATGRRSKRSSRPARSIRSAARRAAVHGRARPGRASRRRRRGRPPQRPEGPVRRRPTTKPTPSPAAAVSLPDVPEWTDRERLGQREGSARLLPHQPSARRARADARALLLAHDQPTSPRWRTATRCSSAA